MNVLVLNGSPKGGRSNTLRLTGAFLEGIRQETDCAVEQLDINKLDIRPCLGCFACWQKTPGKCCISDDMAGVIEKLLWADLTVWSFPLYYFGVPGPLKNLIDRQLPMNLPFMSSGTESGGHPSRYDMSGKKTVVISTCGFYTAKGNYDGVTAMFDHFCGKGGYTSLFCGEGELFRVKELSARTDAYLETVKAAGREYAKGGITAGTRRALEQLLYPREVFEAMADASWGVSPEGEKEDESAVFTRQMASLYNKNAYPGRDIILDMHYTDLEKTYQITLTASGSRVTAPEKPFTTRIHTPFTVWQSIAAGEISGSEALMKHLYKVEGDFSLMLKWDDYFGDPQPEEAPQTVSAEGKTNMTALLLPWIVFWATGAIHSTWGSLAALAACLLVPLLFRKQKLTIYDRLTMPLVGTCALGLLMGAPGRLLIPCSYLLFGLMWTVSCFRPIPLTAHYSMNDYDGEQALQNPIFMKTNRILTAAWGVLYLLTPIWTYAIMGTGIGSWIGAINSVLPLLMGLFTGWFQKWYPARVAKG